MTDDDDNDDEPEIHPAVYNIALVATRVLTMAQALAPIHGEEAVRAGLIVACVEFAERTLGPAGMRAELHEKMARLLDDPAIMDAVHKWLH